MILKNTSGLTGFAFFTAVATTVYFLESMAVRALPIPFLRIGLANVVIVYLLYSQRFQMALVVNILKTLIGGLISFSLMSPATVISLCGGTGALLIMWILMKLSIRFSIVGISIAGAVTHNVIQIFCVRWMVITRDSVFQLLPLLMIIGIVTGMFTGMIALELYRRLEGKSLCS